MKQFKNSSPIRSVSITSPTNESAVVFVGRLLTLGHGTGFTQVSVCFLWTLDSWYFWLCSVYHNSTAVAELACHCHPKVIITAKKLSALILI